LPLDARAEVTREAAMAAMRIDKKVKAGKLRFILMRGIGRAFVTSDYPEDALEATLAGFFS
jgi:3-dehydroquinate synthase